MLSAIETFITSADADTLDFVDGLIAQRRRQLNTIAAMQQLTASQPQQVSLADSLLGAKVFTLYHLQNGNYDLPKEWVVAFERTFGLAPSRNVNISGVASDSDGKTIQFVLRSSGKLSAAFLNLERIETLKNHYNDYVATQATPTSSKASPTTSQKVREAQQLLKDLGLL